MSLFRSAGQGRSEPDDPVVGYEEWRPATRTGLLCEGTLACARCDAPVALGGAIVTPADRLNCPFCLHDAPVRDFLSLGEPMRPARVAIRLVPRSRTVAG